MSDMYEKMLIHSQEYEELRSYLSHENQFATPIRAWSNPPYTIVQFGNNAKVVVKCPDDKPYDFYSGFCCAIVKHLFGGSAVAEMAWDSCRYLATEYKKHEREKIKERSKLIKENARLAQKAKFERDVQDRIYKQKVRDEAFNRMYRAEEETSDIS